MIQTAKSPQWNSKHTQKGKTAMQDELGFLQTYFSLFSSHYVKNTKNNHFQLEVVVTCLDKALFWSE